MAKATVPVEAKKIKYNKCPDESLIPLFELMAEGEPTSIVTEGTDSTVTFENRGAKIEYLVSGGEVTFTLYPRVEGNVVEGTLTDGTCIDTLNQLIQG